LQWAPVAVGAIVAELEIRMMVAEAVVLHMTVSTGTFLTMDIDCTKPALRSIKKSNVL
jgi:hypothetical protein